MTNKTPTRKDVARLAGVSLTTVTHALNPPPNVRMAPSTMQKVRKIAKKIGYRPNFLARALVRKKTFTIALVQPAPDALYNLFYQRIIYGICHSMEQHDYHLLSLFRTSQNMMKVIYQGRIDGLFFLQSDFETKSIIEASETALPIVVINKSWQYHKKTKSIIGCVEADHYKMMDEAFQILKKLNCKTFLTIINPEKIDSNFHMLNAAKKVAKKLELKKGAFKNILPREVTKTIKKESQEIFKQNDKLPLGIIVDGTYHADLCYNELSQLGLKINSDFFLISSTVIPGETTKNRKEVCVFEEQPELMGEKAWELMLNILNGNKSNLFINVPYICKPVSEDIKITEGTERNIK